MQTCRANQDAYKFLLTLTLFVSLPMGSQRFSSTVLLLRSYKFFVDTCLVCVLAHGKPRVLKYSPSSEVFMIADEAMVLWFLENSWDCWKDMMLTGNKKSSAVATKYTLLGDKGRSKKLVVGHMKERINSTNCMLQSSWNERDPLERHLTVFTSPSRRLWPSQDQARQVHPLAMDPKPGLSGMDSHPSMHIR